MAITAQNINQKPGYKQTEVGVIPEDWEVKRLEELGSWKGGATPSMANASFWINGTIYWASSGDIKTKILSKTSSMITDIAVKQSSTTLLQEGAILIVTRSGILRKYLPVAKNTVSIAINQDIKALIPNSRVSADYLLQVLSVQGPDILSTCMKSGTTVESVEYTWLKKYQIPLPPPPEQQAIAIALSDVDALITSFDKLITKKRDIKQAAMQQLLTGKTRLPGFSGELKQGYKGTEVGMIPIEWNPYKFAQIATVRKEKVDPKRISKDTFCIELEHIGQGSGRLIGYSTITEESSLKARFSMGDVLFGRLRAYLRKYWLADRMGICSTEIWPLVPNSDVVTGQYLFQLVQTNQFIETASTAYGTHMPRTDWGVIKNYEVSLPSLNEQRAIATVLSDMDAEIVALEQKRDKTRALKQGMMQELLTGKTRML